MARNDAKEVERQYYEFKRRMEERKGSAPVKKAAPSKPASVAKHTGASTQKSPATEPANAHPVHKAPLSSPAAPISSEELSAQTLSREDVSLTANASPIAESPAEPVSAAQSVESAEDVFVEELPPQDAIETEPVAFTESDAAETFTSDEEEYLPDEDFLAEETEEEDVGEGIMEIVKDAGAKILDGITGLAATLNEKLHSLRGREPDEEADEEDFLSVESDELPAEDWEDDQADAETQSLLNENDSLVEENADKNAPEDLPPADDDIEDIGPSVSEDEPIADIDLSKETFYDEETFEIEDEESDEDEDEESGRDFVALVRNGLAGLKQRFIRRNADETEEEFFEEDADEEDLIGETLDGDLEENDGEYAEEEEEIEDMESASFDFDDDEDDEYEDLMDDDSFESLYEPVAKVSMAETGFSAENATFPKNAQDQEGDINTMDNSNQKSMTELMAEGLNDTPALSRRERRMLAEAAEAKKPAAARKISEDLNRLEETEEAADPTQEYKPVRTPKSDVKGAKKRSIVELDEDDDDEDEEEEEVTRPRRKTKKPAKKSRDYDDDDDDDEDEDEDDDDYDDDEDDDEDLTVSKRIFGFFKGLLAFILIVLLVVFGLQIAEKSGHISLDWLRTKIGGTLPFVYEVFPDPDANAALGGVLDVDPTALPSEN